MIEDKALRSLRALVEFFTSSTKLHMPVRYRVREKSGDRYHLQAVKRGVWPDQTYVSVMPGAAGYDASVTVGSQVLVQFIEGDEAQPIITHFAGPGQPGFTPISVAIVAADMAVAGVGCLVNVSMPPLLPVSGTVSGAPFIGTLTLPTTMLGSIQTGSTKVKVAR